MLTAEQNRALTEIGPGTPMGEYLRRYWHPVAGLSDLAVGATKPIRLFGEDLVLYRDTSGGLGLMQRRCPHRGADLAYGIVEASGLRCNYHGWCFDERGECTSQPFEDVVRGGQAGRGNVRATAYPVAVKGGMIWAYMGPAPAPELPDWEAFGWENGFAQIVVSEVPCNWFQCQENSIDPVHFEWIHENWSNWLESGAASQGPRHLKLDFDEFPYGFVYRRIKDDTDETHENWTVGRVFLWPNAFFLGEHFEWRVPIDDRNTLSILWKFTRVPRDRPAYVQDRIPTWHGPLYDADGKWITSHVMNQDFLAWVGQGPIADRTKEHLGLSDKGIGLIRRRFFAELAAVAAGEEPKGLIRDPAQNRHVELPMMNRQETIDGYTVAEILADPRKRLLFMGFPFQDGQPDEVRKQFEEAMGLEAVAFAGTDLGVVFSGRKAPSAAPKVEADQ